MTMIQFHAADDIGYRFLALLERNNIHPLCGGSIEDELLTLTQLVEVMKNPELASRPEQINILRSAAGLHDLAAKVLAVETLEDFKTLVPHLRLIAERKMHPTSLGQNASSDVRDDTARKFAELYVGCLAVHCGYQLELDSPTNAKGDNPDIIFRLQGADDDENSHRWALAIKTISSSKGQTIFDRIKEGAKQIDSEKCQANHGMVLINAKSSLDHQALWDARFSDLKGAIDALHTQLQELIHQTEKYRPQEEWDELFQGRVVRPILYLGQSLVALPTAAGIRTPTPLKLLVPYGAKGKLDPVGNQLAACMNHFMQTILLGVPGDSGIFPS